MVEAQRVIADLGLYDGLDIGTPDMAVQEPFELPAPNVTPAKLHPSQGKPYKEWMWRRLHEANDDNLVYFDHYNQGRYRQMNNKNKP